MSEGDGGTGGRVRGEERDRGTELGLVIGAAGLQEGWWASEAGLVEKEVARDLAVGLSL